MNKPEFTIALAGNPNCGKSTLFNALTGSEQTIGNWPGVTVEKVEGKYVQGSDSIKVVDLPGIYSLSANSQDERAARDYLLTREADLVVNVLDATNLTRNLYLTSQIIEMGIPMIVVLNMIDLAEKRKIQVDLDHLAVHLKAPVYSVSAIDDKDVNVLKGHIRGHLDSPKISGLTIHYPNEMEDLIAGWIPFFEAEAKEMGVSPRWMAVRLAEEDPDIIKLVEKKKNLPLDEYHSSLAVIEKILGDSADVIIADYKFGMANSIGKEVITFVHEKRSRTDVIDAIAMHRFLGVPVFLAAMYLVFWVTVNLGGAFADFFDILFGTIFVHGFGALLGVLHAPEWLIVLLAGGLGSGIQAVATFVPFIFFMFFMLSILEDSGYMARAAYVMDKFMSFLGLPGKAFVPMLVGFGCTVPAILATRTLDTNKDRMMTIFMSPLMSCGARLPVYALFAAAFFSSRSGAVVFSLYLIGIVLAVVTGFLVKNTLFHGEPSHLIMELPRYHSPRLKHILLHTWTRLRSFIIRAGKVIIFSVFVLGFFSSMGIDGTFGNENSEKALLSVAGQKVTPLFHSMGIEDDNWPATVGLFTGVLAKESIVGTLSVLYGQEEAGQGGADAAANMDSEVSGFSLLDGLMEALISIPEGLAAVFGISGEAVEDFPENEGIFLNLRNNFSPASAYSYLLFVLIYFPCVAAFAAAVRQMGIGYGALQAIYLTILAWSVATLYFQIVEGHNPVFIIGGIGGIVFLYLLFFFIGKVSRRKVR
ncbi:MAG: Fe(2+) transporter permease subunit FeoB [Spirochaetales bacterium]|nr:Fe(2+) transporter permease subunit FeoB [Spirochaetales bacterium]